MLVGRNAHQGREGGEMFTLALRHVLGKVIEVQGGKGIDFLLGPELTVVGAAGGAAADAECRAPEGAIRGGFQNLDANGLLMWIVLPRQLAETAARTGIWIT